MNVYCVRVCDSEEILLWTTDSKVATTLACRNYDDTRRPTAICRYEITDMLSLPDVLNAPPSSVRCVPAVGYLRVGASSLTLRGLADALQANTPILDIQQQHHLTDAQLLSAMEQIIRNWDELLRNQT